MMNNSLKPPAEFEPIDYEACEEISLSDCFPNVSPQDLLEAEDRFAHYAALVVRMETRRRSISSGELTKAVECGKEEEERSRID
jgi:hypothetical protein